MNISFFLRHHLQYREWEVNIDDDFCILSNPVISGLRGRPVKLDFTMFTLCLSGVVVGHADLIPFRLEPNDVRHFFIGQLLDVDECSENYSSLSLLISSSFMRSLNLDVLFMSIGSNGLHGASFDQSQSFKQFVSVCKDIIEKDPDREKREVIRLLTKAYILEMSHFSKGMECSLKDNLALSNVKIREFLSYVRKDYTKHHQVQYYADALFMSPKALSGLVKRATGHGANFWIERMLLMDAKNLLINTDSQVRTISDMLGFSNQTVFGRFFYQKVGCTAVEYRKNHKR